MVAPDGYQSRFLDAEDDHLFRALDLSDRINIEIADSTSALTTYLGEARETAREAMASLLRCDPRDTATIEKAQADARAYWHVRAWVSSRLQDGDRAYAESENPAGDDLEDDGEGLIPIPE